MPNSRPFACARASADTSGGRCFLAVLATALGAAWLLLAAGVPVALVLITLSVIMVLTGLALAAVLFLAGSRPTRALAAPWEIAASLVFLGVAAGILSNGTEAVALLDAMHSGLAGRPHG